MIIIITLREFLMQYSDVNTVVSVKTYDKTYPALSVAEWLKNMKKYEDIMDEEIAIIGVENNVMVIYL